MCQRQISDDANVGIRLGAQQRRRRQDLGTLRAVGIDEHVDDLQAVAVWESLVAHPPDGFDRRTRPNPVACDVQLEQVFAHAQRYHSRA